MRSLHPKGTRLPLELIVSYVKQIAAALDYAHQQHVIHRDVKPENTLLGVHNEVILSDFGIAIVQHTLDSLPTQNQAGTPAYMAPEQIQGKPSPASDQYALGVLVYEWLCGEPPFRGSPFQVMSQHLHQPPPSLRAKVPSLPLAVEDAVFAALAKQPQERFVSLQDFADVLEEVCFATQSLSLDLPSVSLSQDQISMQVPSSMEQDASSSTMQPLVTTREHKENKEEPALLDALPSVSQSKALSRHEGVSISRTNRQRLLRRVRAFWITGVLEHSLHGVALMTLGLQEQPDAVAHAWPLELLQWQGAIPHPLPAGTRIQEVYNAADGELLILGAPGSGKTTLLLELARTLLDAAEREESYPLPVVFNLSSWSGKRQRLTDWLVDELLSKYQVPHALSQTLVDADQILPLLDGLDEVIPQDRTACIEAINGYRQEHGLLPLVVCSRSADYLAQTTRLEFGSAIVVQPLSTQQIDDYLASGGEQLDTLRMALRQDATLRELVSTPLMLSILTLAYHDMPIGDLLRIVSAEALKRQIFEYYVDRMLKHRSAHAHYTSQQTTYWLSYLARQMNQHRQTIFYIERMQPNWLPESGLRHFYGRAVKLGIGFVSGIIIFLFIGIAITLFMWSALGLSTGLIVGPVIGLLSGLFGGLAIGLTSLIETEIHPAEVIVWSWKKPVAIRSLKGRLRVGMSSGLLISLIVVIGLNAPGIDLVLLLVAIVVTALLVTVSIIAASGLTSGVSSSLQDERHLTLPNQGIRSSAWNSIRIGIIGGLVGGIISVVAFGIILILGHAVFSGGFISLLYFLLMCGSIGGTINGLVVGLANGGIACIQHFTLRFLLWRSRYVPWNYPYFLNYTVDCILLRKLGGGYLFIHRLLLDYLASLDSAPSLN